jgi:hypothetical protein
VIRQVALNYHRFWSLRYKRSPQSHREQYPTTPLLPPTERSEAATPSATYPMAVHALDAKVVAMHIF